MIRFARMRRLIAALLALAMLAFVAPPATSAPYSNRLDRLKGTVGFQEGDNGKLHAIFGHEELGDQDYAVTQDRSAALLNLPDSSIVALGQNTLVQVGAFDAGVTGPGRLVDVAEDIFRTDLDAGYITVLVEMIAGASSPPGLGPEVSDRIRPWREFARTTIETAVAGSPMGSVLPAGDVAHAVVALYLGLEMLSHLDGDPDPALALFGHARQLASLLEALSTPATTTEESP